MSHIDNVSKVLQTFNLFANQSILGQTPITSHLQSKLLLDQRVRYSKTFKAKKSQVVHHLSKWLHKMIIKPRCKQSFMGLVHIRRKRNIVQQIIFVLLILQMSALFAFKLVIVCLILTCLVSLRQLCSSSSSKV